LIDNEKIDVKELKELNMNLNIELSKTIDYSEKYKQKLNKLNTLLENKITLVDQL